jgi:hypothetical protein
MTHFKYSLVTLLLVAAVSPSFATSSATSLASESVATSVGSVSNSFQRSSASSSRPATPLSEGDYKVIEMAALAERPGTLRLTLQAVADESAQGQVVLYLPQAAVDQGRVAQGQLVTARHRPYGVEFASAETRRAFFLVLDDDWYRELQTNAVTL